MEVLIINTVFFVISIVCLFVIFFMAYDNYKRCDRMLKRIDEFERRLKNVS